MKLRESYIEVVQFHCPSNHLMMWGRPTSKARAPQILHSRRPQCSHWMSFTISQLRLNVVSPWQTLTIWTQGTDGAIGASGTWCRCQPITGNGDFSSAS